MTTEPDTTSTDTTSTDTTSTDTTGRPVLPPTITDQPHPVNNEPDRDQWLWKWIGLTHTNGTWKTCNNGHLLVEPHHLGTRTQLSDTPASISTRIARQLKPNRITYLGGWWDTANQIRWIVETIDITHPEPNDTEQRWEPPENVDLAALCTNQQCRAGTQIPTTPAPLGQWLTSAITSLHGRGKTIIRKPQTQTRNSRTADDATQKPLCNLENPAPAPK